MKPIMTPFFSMLIFSHLETHIAQGEHSTHEIQPRMRDVKNWKSEQAVLSHT